MQGRFEGREEQSLTFFWVGEERAGRSANKRGSSNILRNVGFIKVGLVELPCFVH